MKNRFLGIWLALLFVAVTACGYGQVTPAGFPGATFGNIGGSLYASNFNEWSIPQGSSPTNTQIIWSSPSFCVVTSGGVTFQPFAVGSPITIVDANPAHTEVVTITQYSQNNYSCQIQAVMQYTHYSYHVTSATGGLQEAINWAAGLQYEVIVTSDWVRAGGTTSMITHAQGNYNASILDERSSFIEPYLWNGSIYVAQPFGGVTSVFGRTGAIVSEDGDYTCNQVTGCPTVYVTSFNSRNGVVTPQTGDYTCAMVSGCNPTADVSSVFGRTGTVVAANGDYNCTQVTGCNPNALVNSVFGRTGAVTAQTGDYIAAQVTSAAIGPYSSFIATLAAAQASTDVTAQITLSSGTMPAVVSSGAYFVVDNEWEEYTGITANGGSSYTLTGITRGAYATSAASHLINAQLGGEAFSLYPSTQANEAYAGGSLTGGYFFAVNCPTTSSSLAAFLVNCGSTQFGISRSTGAMTVNSASPSGFAGTGGFYAGVNTFGSHNPAITSTVNVIQGVQASQMFQPIGLGGGVAGSMRSVVPGTIPAATLTSAFIGSGTCNITYEVTGVDGDGNTIAGTPITISNLAAPPFAFPGKVNIQGPYYAGAVSYQAYRTAVSAGCSPLALGQWASAITSSYPFFQDAGTGGDGSTPPSTTALSSISINTTAPFTGGWGVLSGASGTPPVTCTSSLEGWEYHNTSAAASPAIQRCLSGTWTGLLPGGVTSVFGRAGAVVAASGDYTASQVTNAAATNAANSFTQAQLAPAWNLPSVTSGPQTLLFDDFYTTANIATGVIGVPTGDTCLLANTVADVNHPGEFAATSGTGGTGTGVFCDYANTSVGAQIVTPNSSLGWIWETEVNVPVLPGTTAGAYQAGMTHTVSANPWTTGIGFYLSSANATVNDWYCQYGTTYVDSTVAATTSWTRLTMKNDGTNLHFYVGGTEVCGTGIALAGIPSTQQVVGIWTSTALSGTSVAMYVDYLTFQRAVSR